MTTSIRISYFRSEAMCPQLGYEADTGVEVPPTGLTPVEERRVHSAVSPSHSYLAFFFGGF